MLCNIINRYTGKSENKRPFIKPEYFKKQTFFLFLPLSTLQNLLFMHAFQVFHGNMHVDLRIYLHFMEICVFKNILFIFTFICIPKLILYACIPSTSQLSSFHGNIPVHFFLCPFKCLLPLSRTHMYCL